jgi:hypothetical protein
MRVIVSLVLLLSGCATHGVRCHGPLSPINEPAAIPPVPAAPDGSLGGSS